MTSTAEALATVTKDRTTDGYCICKKCHQGVLAVQVHCDRCAFDDPCPECTICEGEGWSWAILDQSYRPTFKPLNKAESEWAFAGTAWTEHRCRES